MHRTIAFAVLLAFAAPAAAQTTSSPAKAVQHLPKGIPGFLDPATGLFHPLVPSGDASSISGTVTMVVENWDFQKDYDTVSCTLEVNFGNEVGGQFFSNHSASASFDFASKDAPTRIPLSFDYTPNGNGTPTLEYELNCTAEGADQENEGNASGQSDLADGGQFTFSTSIYM